MRFLDIGGYFLGRYLFVVGGQLLVVVGANSCRRLGGMETLAWERDLMARIVVGGGSCLWEIGTVGR